jgi:hypothetical protein
MLFDPKLGHAVIGGQVEIFAVISDQCAMLDAAKGVRLFEHRVEDRREVSVRRVDDLQHLGDRGLPLLRLVSLGSAFGKLTLQIRYELLAIG